MAGDLLTGQGIGSAVEGAGVIVHCASSNKGDAPNRASASLAVVVVRVVVVVVVVVRTLTGPLGRLSTARLPRVPAAA